MHRLGIGQRDLSSQVGQHRKVRPAARSNLENHLPQLGFVGAVVMVDKFRRHRQTPAADAHQGGIHAIGAGSAHGADDEPVVHTAEDTGKRGVCQFCRPTDN